MIAPKHVSTTQIADVMSKTLGCKEFRAFICKLDIVIYTLQLFRRDIESVMD